MTDKLINYIRLSVIFINMLLLFIFLYSFNIVTKYLSESLNLLSLFTRELTFNSLK